MALTTDQKASRNFKKGLGKGETTTTRDFYEEPYSGRPTVLPSQIWDQASDIPDTAPTLAPDAISGVVQYKEDLVLTAVPGTANAFYHADLKNAIPFDYGDGTSYLYSLKDSTSASIAFGQGEWVVDPDAGVLSFYGSVPSNMPPKITFYKYVGTTGLQTADYRSLATETANRTIYLATTGDDDTGDGSIGSPFFSLHRALKDIKPTIDCDITITVADGSYDYSSLGILNFNKKLLASRSFKIVPTSISTAVTEAFNVVSTGTFTSNLNNIHTESGASWTPGEHKGKFLKAKTVLSGTPPPGASSIDYGLLPIIDNGTDWIKTAFVYPSFSNDFGEYDILTHKVEINLGGEDLVVKDDSLSITVLGIRLTTIGDVEDTWNPPYKYGDAKTGTNLTFNNSRLDISQTANGVIFFGSYVAFSGGLNVTGATISSYLSCPFTNTGFGNFRFKDGSEILATTFEHTGSANVALLEFFQDTSVTMRGDIEFIGGKYALETNAFSKVVNHAFACRLHFDGQEFFIKDTGNNVDINVASGMTFVTEPSIARLTLDGTTEADHYYNAETGLNALAIAPDAQKVLYQGTLPLDYRSLAISTSSLTYYISPTGDDVTGDGSSGSPWFSIHRVHTALPPIVGASVTVKCNTGTYDFSSLGDLNFYKKFTTGMFIIQSSDCTTSLAEGFTVDSSDAFTSNSGNIHTKSGGSWTPGALKGGFIRVKTVFSGSIGATDLFNAYSIFPIVDNGVDWIETPYAYATYSNDFNTFDFISHKVELNFSTNDISLSDGIMLLRPSGIKIYAGAIIDDDGGKRESQYAIHVVASDINCSQILSTPVFYNSRLATATYLTKIYQATTSYLTSSYSSTGNASFQVGNNGRIWSTTIENTSGGNTILLGSPLTNLSHITFVGNIVFKGGKSCIQSNGSDIFNFFDNYGLSFTLDAQSFFIWNRFGTLNITGGVATFNSEPTVARMSEDNTNASTEYYNAETDLNCLVIAPDTYKKLYQGILPLDYRSLATETVSRTIYIATTGSDTTGDGSVGSPFYSLHRAFKDIKPLVNAIITIKCADGDYDYTSLGDCVGSFTCINDGNVIISASDATIDNNFTSLSTPVTGTFTSNDPDRPIHTDSGESWTTDEFLGNFIRVNSVLSGSALTGASKFIPIAANSADTITGAMWYFDNYNYGDYEIVKHKVHLNFGTSNFISFVSNLVNMEFKEIEITCSSIRRRNDGSVSSFIATEITIQSCKLNGSCELNSQIKNSYINNTQGLILFYIYQSVLVSNGSNGSFGNSKANNISGATIRRLDGTNTNNYLNSYGIGDIEIFNLYSINTKAHFYIGYCGKFSISGKIGHSGGVKFVVETVYVKGLNILDNYSDLYGGVYALDLVDSVVTANLTFDGSTEASYYVDLVESFNAIAIAPTASQKLDSKYDVEITDETKGIILTTPDGTTRYRITIDNSGNIVTTSL